MVDDVAEASGTGWKHQKLPAPPLSHISDDTGQFIHPRRIIQFGFPEILNVEGADPESFLFLRIDLKSWCRCKQKCDGNHVQPLCTYIKKFCISWCICFSPNLPIILITAKHKGAKNNECKYVCIWIINLFIFGALPATKMSWCIPPLTIHISLLLV